MIRFYRILFFLFVLAVFIMGTIYFTKRDVTVAIDKYTSIQRLPDIKPDYSGTIIPPNIAPLNFLIEETGIHYYVKIYSAEEKGIELFSKDPKVIIPIKQWRKLLETNRGKEIYFDVYVCGADGGWEKFDTFKNLISNEKIDGYLVYRLIKPLYSYWDNISIHQRNLENYDESVVLSNKSIDNGCVNCHTFLKNSPSNMLMHIRSEPKPTMLLFRNGTVTSIFSQTPFSSASMAYSSWHPSGRFVAFSVNGVNQFFHSAGAGIRDVVDRDSAIGIYDVELNTIITPANLSNSDFLETYPSWAPDGRYLYYCNAPIIWADRNLVPPEGYEKVRYDLMRIRFKPENGEWGESENVLLAKDTGLSITQPRISPNGRFLLFCMADYGCFPIYQPSADLYIMDLKTLQYKKWEINSDESDSWHCWSSSGRWIVFSSKRLANIFARPFFSYINENGEPSKPILLPQKDPTFYDSYIKTYNVPEFITHPIQVSRREFEMAIHSPQKITGVESVTSATPGASSTPEPYRQK